MGGLHSQEEAMYVISWRPHLGIMPGHRVYVYACWDGEWWCDRNRFYDLFDENGRHLNLGEPWFDDPNVPVALEDAWEDMPDEEREEITLTGGQGTPTLTEVQDAMDALNPWEGEQ